MFAAGGRGGRGALLSQGPTEGRSQPEGSRAASLQPFHGSSVHGVRAWQSRRRGRADTDRGRAGSQALGATEGEHDTGGFSVRRQAAASRDSLDGVKYKIINHEPVGSIKLPEATGHFPVKLSHSEDCQGAAPAHARDQQLSCPSAVQPVHSASPSSSAEVGKTRFL